MALRPVQKTAACTDTSTNWASPVATRRAWATRAPARRLGGRVEPRLRHRDAHRAPVAVSVERHGSPHRGQGEIRRLVVGVRPGLTERREGHIDEVRPHRPQRLEAQPVPLHHTGAGVLDEEVGAGDQGEEIGATGLLVQVEHDTALAPIERLEGQAGRAGRLIAGERAPRTGPASRPAAPP